ncbi:hypothetical protein CAEBREN_16896 [Caenorhabditis brenneri]|uniref:PAN-3 domain-containing protein n=1 Tax=Caenorhabditis brenneri TaxID=135651 RepID=G0NDQ5_CAEBE|nr:hypothetical protein CAEBREN_16896 [Caenorhabditis brenneri]
MLEIVIFAFISLLSLIETQTDLNSMVVTYGQPLDYSEDHEVYATSFWDNCVRYCYLESSCVAAYSPASPVHCQIFSANQLQSVKRLNSSDGQLVAFKIQPSYTTCPAAKEQPLANAYGTSSDSTRNYTYMINQDDPNDMWYFTYNSEYPHGTLRFRRSILDISKCDPGWNLFKRPKGYWCMQVFGGPSEKFTQAEAEAQCDFRNANLSGLESQEEKSFVIDSATSLLGSKYPNFSAFWLSGIRKPECEQDGWQDISYCNDNIEQFTFSDTYLSAYSGMVWDYNQPDRNAAGYWQNCIQVWIREEYQVPHYDYTRNPNGAVDDAPCDEAENPYYAMRGFVCGKPAE